MSSFDYVSKIGAGGSPEKLTYSASRPQKIEAIEARNATDIASVQLAVGVKGAYTAVCLARGDQAKAGDQIMWSGDVTLRSDEEIVALFYGTDSGDKLELTVKLRDVPL